MFSLIRFQAQVHAIAGRWGRILPLGPRLLSQAKAADVSSEAKDTIITLLIIASSESDLPDRAMFDQALGLLPENTEEWDEGDVARVARGLAEFKDERGLKILDHGKNPVGGQRTPSH